MFVFEEGGGLDEGAVLVREWCGGLVTNLDELAVWNRGDDTRLIAFDFG